MFVLDASAVLAWCFLDEQPADSDAILKRLRTDALAAPSHWPLEVTNILSLAQRKGRISPDQIAEFLEQIEGLDVEIDAETSDRAWVEIRALAMLEGLTTCDAAYLELAMRRDARLVSKDADLLSAARRRKVPVLDLSV